MEVGSSEFWALIDCYFYNGLPKFFEEDCRPAHLHDDDLLSLVEDGYLQENSYQPTLRAKRYLNLKQEHLRQIDSLKLFKDSPDLLKRRFTDVLNWHISRSGFCSPQWPHAVFDVDLCNLLNYFGWINFGNGDFAQKPVTERGLKFLRTVLDELGLEILSSLQYDKHYDVALFQLIPLNRWKALIRRSYLSSLLQNHNRDRYLEILKKFEAPTLEWTEILANSPVALAELLAKHYQERRQQEKAPRLVKVWSWIKGLTSRHRESS